MTSSSFVSLTTRFPSAPAAAAALLVVLLSGRSSSVDSFVVPSSTISHTPFIVPRRTMAASSSTTTSLGMGTNRRARRMTKKKQEKNRPQKSFYDAVAEAERDDKVPVAAAIPEGRKEGGGKKDEEKSNLDKEVSGERTTSEVGGSGESVTSGASVADANSLPESDRPELSTVVVDEQTGIERIQQGKAVMDVVTRKAVKLSDLGPEYRLAQMFPGVPPEVRDRHRVDWNAIEVPELIERLRTACSVSLPDGSKGLLPEHPSVSNDGLDFVIANRDRLGFRMKKTLGRLKLRAQSLGDLDEAKSYRALWKHFLTIEDSVSAPFRQMLLDAEGKIGPNFGNLELKSYAGGELYERAASYVVLKGMVAHWEKKVRDAEFVESTPQTRNNFMEVLSTGDPKRYLPDPPILFRLQEVSKVCLMAQKMTSEFVKTPELFDDLPVELRFLEQALTIKGGTALRKFTVDEFCPREGIAAAALREGLRRFDAQLENMQIDPYGDLKNTVGRLCEALAVGTDDDRDPYATYLINFDQSGPGYFQTYTFDHDKNSLVRFLDSAKRIEEGTAGSMDDINRQLGNELQDFFGFGGSKKKKEEETERERALREEEENRYVVPEKRACGRPHMLGWLDALGDEEVDGIVDDEGKEGGVKDDAKLEADEWSEVK